jgi:hypothetical protein
VGEPIISRGEAVALLFNVSDIANTLSRIEQLLEDGDDENDEDS